MQHAQTIAMARELLAEGRAVDVERMLAPLVRPVADVVPEAADEGAILVRCLLARVRLLHDGDPAQAYALLRPFEAAAAGEGLPVAVQAEVELWLGWLHAWHYTPTYDDVRALNRLDRAERLFCSERNPAGRCWALLGRALAYFTLDEYPLMQRAIEAARSLQAQQQDVQAACWLLDLTILHERFAGRYMNALAQATSLATQATQTGDRFAHGRALAYRATLQVDLGRPPEVIAETAAEAVNTLRRATAQPGYALLAAYRAGIRARLRSGEAAEASRLISDAVTHTEQQPTAAAHLLLQQAHLDLLSEQAEAARHHLAEVDARMRPHQHRLLASDAALMWCAWHEYMDRMDEAREWAERGLQNARKTGHESQQVLALLYLVRVHLCIGALNEARRCLAATEPFRAYFSVLPVAALRCWVMSRLAAAEGLPDEAWQHLAQAHSAYTLIGDRHRSAQVKQELYTLPSSSSDPDRSSTSSPFPPAPQEGRTAQPLGTNLGAALTRAALSETLVAETWLAAAERLLPDRWLGLYRCDDGTPWTCVREYGAAPTVPHLEEPCGPHVRDESILWLRLRSHPGPAYFFGVEVKTEPDAAWKVASAYLQPWLPVVSLALEHALLRAEWLESSAVATVHLSGLQDIVYASPTMHDLARQIHQVQASHSPVLLTGEHGVGKVSIARAIHQLSDRRQKPFVIVSCRTLTDASPTSYLFGTSGQPGALHEAQGGTLFLDEVGALPLATQRRLLRWLEEGPENPSPDDGPARLMAATTEDLRARVRQGTVLEALYYRLSVIVLHVPPLRERQDDIPVLIRHFADRIRPEGAMRPTFTREALGLLVRYAWPGNVRQLRNEIERLLHRVRSEPAPLIDVQDLSEVVRDEAAAKVRPNGKAAAASSEPGQDLDTVLADTEKMLLERTLQRHGGQVAAAAKTLGLSRQGLYKKIKRLGIDVACFQEASSTS